MGMPITGVLLLSSSAVIFSTAGLFTGLVQVDVWTMLFWRGAFGGLFIAAYLGFRYGRRIWPLLRGMGWPDLAVGSCSTLGTICFIHALRLTSVAEVTVLYATAPFIAMAMTWLWLGQTESRATLGASLLALGGVLIMAGATPEGRHLAGNMLALTMTALIATMMVLIRRYRAVSMLPAACLSGFACALIAFPFARPFDITGLQFFWLAVFGSMQFGLGLLLLTLGSRSMSGAQAALLGNLELPLGPLWAWLAMGQVPSQTAWIGGGVVTLALALDLAVNLRRPVEKTSPAN